MRLRRISLTRRQWCPRFEDREAWASQFRDAAACLGRPPVDNGKACSEEFPPSRIKLREGWGNQNRNLVRKDGPAPRMLLG